MTHGARATNGAPDVRRVGDRVEQLLGDVRSMVSPPAWDRIDDLMRQLLGLYGAALGRIVALLDPATPGGEALRTQLLQDDLLASLLLLHGVHPESFTARVRHALERVRPYLGSHGGGIELLDADVSTGIVRLKMEGSCDGCPSASITIQLAVESAIKDIAPEVTRIEVAAATQSLPETAAPPLSKEESTAAPPIWVSLGEMNGPAPGEVAARDVQGTAVVLCRIGEALYAYRDACAACGARLADATLAGAVLACSTCGRRYDLRRAGRALQANDLHLEPLPLLQEASVVRVAVHGAAA